MTLPHHICLLGGAGFLGSHLTQALLARGVAQVTVLDTSFHKLELSPGQRRALRCVEGSVTDPARLHRALEGAEVVLSLTALCNPSLYNREPRAVIAASYDDLLPVVERCTDEGRWLVHFSTCEVYGKPWPGDEAMHEQRSPLVLGPVRSERWTYACAKQLMERLIWAQVQHAGLKATIVRPFNVIGPRMDYLDGVDGSGVPRVLACFMGALLRQQPLQLVDGGRARRAFMDVDDFTDAVARLLERPAACQGEILNLGHPHNDISIAELARQMIAIYAAVHGGDPELPCRSVAAEELYGPGYDDTLYRVPDVSRARQLLGWQPRRGLDQLLPAIIEDYVRRYRGRL